MPADVSGVAELSLEEKRSLLERFLREETWRIDEEYPLSHGQQALWFFHRLEPKSSVYNESWVWRIRSGLDIKLLRSAFQALQARHPLLRTTYAVSADGPRQRVITPRRSFSRGLTPRTGPPEQLRERLVAEARRPFDLEKGPVARFFLFSLSPQEHLLLSTVHHLVIDLWSMIALMGELQIIYAMLKAGLKPRLPALPASYKDFVTWQARMLAGPKGNGIGLIGKSNIGGELPAVQLPTDRPRPPVQTFRGASHAFHIGAGLTRRLKELARQEQATLFIPLVAGLYALLHRYTGQEDIVVGGISAGRSRPEFEKVIGYFANMLPLRCDLSGRPTFRDPCTPRPGIEGAGRDGTPRLPVRAADPEAVAEPRSESGTAVRHHAPASERASGR